MDGSGEMWMETHNLLPSPFLKILGRVIGYLFLALFSFFFFIMLQNVLSKTLFLFFLFLHSHASPSLLHDTWRRGINGRSTYPTSGMKQNGMEWKMLTSSVEV